MLVVAGYVRIDKEHLPGVVLAARRMMKETRKEPDCLSSSFAMDLLDDSVIRIFEEWDSAEALQAHFRTSHMAEFQKTLAGLNLQEMSVQRYEVAQVGPLRA